MNILYESFLPMVENSFLEHIVKDEKKFVETFLEKVEDESNILFINLNTWSVHSTFQHIIKKKSINISIIFQPNSNQFDIKQIKKKLVGEELEKKINYYNNFKQCFDEKISNTSNNNIKFHYVYFLHLYSLDNFQIYLKHIRESCFPVSIWKINLFLTKNDLNESLTKNNKSISIKFLEPEHPFLETIDLLKYNLTDFITNQKIEEILKTSYLFIGEKIRYNIEFTIDQTILYKNRLVDVI